MSDSHSAHLVELNQIAEYRLAIQTTAMLETGMRHALLDALDRWEVETPFKYFLVLVCPNGHVHIEMLSQSLLDDAVLRTFEHLNGEECSWNLKFIDDRARQIWEDALDLWEFMHIDATRVPAGVTVH